MFKEKKVQNFHSIFEQAMLLKIHFVQNLNFYYVQEIAGENPSFVKVYFFFLCEQEIHLLSLGKYCKTAFHFGSIY